MVKDSQYKGNMLLSNMETEFKYKSGEYAKKLGITKEALRSRRRRGELETEYIIQNEITLWREPPSQPRKTIPGPCSTIHGPWSAKRARRRGVHGSGIATKYPNQAMQQHNELKMLAKLQRNLDPEIQELLPEGIEQAKKLREQRQQRLQKELMQPVRKYGEMLRGVQYTKPKHSTGWKTVLEEDRKIEEENRPLKKKYPEYY